MNVGGERFTPEEVTEMDNEAGRRMENHPAIEKQSEDRAELIGIYLEAVGENAEDLDKDPIGAIRILETAQAFDEVQKTYEASVHPKPLSIGKKTVEIWPKDIEKTRAGIVESLKNYLQVLESPNIPQGAFGHHRDEERQQAEIVAQKERIARVESGDKDAILPYLRRNLKSRVEGMVMYDPKFASLNFSATGQHDMAQLQRAREINLAMAVNGLDLIETVSGNQG